MFKSKIKTIEIAQNDGEEVRKSTILRIEEITLQMIEEIHSLNFPKITYHHRTLESLNSMNQLSFDTQNINDSLNGNLEDLPTNITTSFDSSRSLSWTHDIEDIEEENEANSSISSKNSTTVDFRRQNSRKNLILIITVMSHVHQMLINGTTKNRRALYYELQSEPTNDLVKTQRALDHAVNHVASLLECAPWELGFTATSKGLVCGDLKLIFSGHDTISCNAPGGVLIPQNIFRLTSARTSANYVLVVEKDAVFQKLLQENCSNHLNCILITGKGYPDINTRMLVSLLGNKLKIPVYVLVDSDPFGVEIMCIYRFGSSIRSRENEELTCPTVRWLGIHPSEYSALVISPKILTNCDQSRLDSLKLRNYITDQISKELEIMSEKGKVEIETVANLSQRFLTTVYLPRKIHAKEFI